MGCLKKGIKIPHILAFEIIVVVFTLYHYFVKKSTFFEIKTATEYGRPAEQNDIETKNITKQQNRTTIYNCGAVLTNLCRFCMPP